MMGGATGGPRRKRPETAVSAAVRRWSAAGRAADGYNQGNTTQGIMIKVSGDATGWWEGDGAAGRGRGKRLRGAEWMGRDVGGEERQLRHDGQV